MPDTQPITYERKSNKQVGETHTEAINLPCINTSCQDQVPVGYQWFIAYREAISHGRPDIEGHMVIEHYLYATFPKKVTCPSCETEFTPTLQEGTLKVFHRKLTPENSQLTQLLPPGGSDDLDLLEQQARAALSQMILKPYSSSTRNP